MRFRFLAGVMLVTVVGLVPGGCNGKDGKKKSTPARPRVTRSAQGVVRIRIPREVPTLNPLERERLDIWRLAFPWLVEPLVRVHPVSGKILGVLAKSWKPMKREGKVMGYRFQLRTGVQWHDGKRLDADDVRFSLGLVTDGQKRPSKLAKKPVGRLKSLSRHQLPVAEVSVLGDHVFEIHLSMPYGPFLERLARVPILPEHKFEECSFESRCRKTGGEEGGAKKPFCRLKIDTQPCRMVGKAMVGTGPFELLQWWPGEKIIYLRNDDYWGKKPHLKRVEFHVVSGRAALEKKLIEGELDIITGLNGNGFQALYERLVKSKRKPGFRAETLNPPGVSLLLFRGTKNRFLRRAVSMLLDRKALVKRLPGRKVSLVKHPVSYDSYQQRLFLGAHYGGGPKSAYKLLDRVGWKRSGKGVRRRPGQKLSFRVVLPRESVAYHHYFEKEAEAFKKHGIHVKVERIPEFSYLAGLAGQSISGRYSSAARALKVTNTIGPKTLTVVQFGQVNHWTDLYEAFHSSRRGPLRTRDGALDGLLDKWALETQRKKRKALAAKALERLWQLAAVLPLHPPVVPLVVSSRVKGVASGGAWLDLVKLKVGDETP